MRTDDEHTSIGTNLPYAHLLGKKNVAYVALRYNARRKQRNSVDSLSSLTGESKHRSFCVCIEGVF